MTDSTKTKVCRLECFFFLLFIDIYFSIENRKVNNSTTLKWLVIWQSYSVGDVSTKDLITEVTLQIVKHTDIT